jgi:pullulanase
LPGLLAWSLHDPAGLLDPAHRLIVVLWNAAGAPAVLNLAALAGTPLVLHPVLVASDDPVVRAAAADANGSVRVPGRTAAVFWTPSGTGE